MMFNLAVIVRETAAAVPDRPAILTEGARMTYADLDVRSDEFAEGLVALGVCPGDVVAVQLPNVAEFPVAYFGILKAGAVVVPLNILLRAPEIAHHLTDSGARVLITWASVQEEAALAAASAGVRDVFVVGDPGVPPGADPGGAPGAEAGAEASGVAGRSGRAGGRPLADLPLPASAGRPIAARHPCDTAVIVYTAGTTGWPKGTELTHFQLYMNADIPGRTVGVTPEDVILTALPLFHAFGLSVILNLGVRFGCALSLVPRFTPEAVLATIQRDRATVFDGVPTMFVALLTCPDLARYDTSSLRLTVCGGAAMPAHVLDEFERRVGVPVLEGYGMTETAVTMTQNRSVSERRRYSVGQPVWGTELQVWGADGVRLPPGPDHVGELVTRGHHTMKGYHNAPEATAEVFSGGWLHTGDLGYQDADGYVFIVDRKKELIIRGGYNVYPREVEEVLYSHPAVANAAAVGVPDPRLGEEVKAFIEVKAGAQVTQQQIVAYCRERLAAYKYPRLVEFRQSLPTSGVGKVLKKGLR
jgi:long-chain acyl-CoA synthetase